MPTIFVPTRFKRRVLRTVKKATLVSDEMWGLCRGIPVKGFMMELPPREYAATYFPLSDIHESFLTEFKQESATTVTPLTPTERKRLRKRFEFKLNHPFDMDISSNDVLQLKEAVATMLHFIEAILLTTTYRVTLHLRTLPAFEPYYDENHLHIVIGSAPPGDATKQALLDPLLLLHMGKDDDEMCVGPTKHRGTIINSDGNEYYDGQIVGSTLFIFLPLRGDLLTLYGSRENNPFRKRLAAVWQAFLNEKIEPKHTLDSDPIQREEFAERIDSSSVHAMLLAEMDDEIVKMQARTQQLQKLLTVLLTDMRTKIAIRDGLQARKINPYTPQVDGLWELVSHHPLIERITSSDERRIIYHTKPVHIEDDEGNLRNVGTFAVMADDFSIHVWSTGPTHPKRIAHPHIASHENSICYGNITTEISELCSQDRHTEAVLLVLRWLTEGYEPTLTYHRIEEWPLAETKETAGA